MIPAPALDDRPSCHGRLFARLLAIEMTTAPTVAMIARWIRVGWSVGTSK